MRIRPIFLTAMLAASAALASTLAAAPPAAADVFQPAGRPVTLCSQGESRKNNTSPVPRATPISLLTVMWTGCATRASASLSVTEGYWSHFEPFVQDLLNESRSATGTTSSCL